MVIEAIDDKKAAAGCAMREPESAGQRDAENMTSRESELKHMVELPKILVPCSDKWIAPGVLKELDHSFII